MKTNRKGKKRKIWVWILPVLVVGVVVAALLLNPFGRTGETTFRTWTVSRGNLDSTITGSGTLQAEDVEKIDLPNGIVVSQVIAEAGDSVRKGDPLAALDPKSLADRAAYLSDQLAAFDKNISSRETSRYIYAPVKGRIKDLPVAKGDDVVGTSSERGALALISTDGLMRIEVTTDQSLSLNGEVTVKWSGASRTGTVAEKTPAGYVVTLTDKGTPYKKTAQIYSGETRVGEGVIEINAPIPVYGNGGTIRKIHREENSYVYVGTTLFTLDNAVESSSYRLAVSDRNEMARQLQTVLTYVNDPRVVATQDGLVGEVLVTVNQKVGEESGGSGGSQSDGAGATAGASGTAAAAVQSTAQSAAGDSAAADAGLTHAFSIHTGGAVKMIIDVDELDVDAALPGQEAIVTLDAFAGESCKAKVSHISKLGETSGNITTYPVELSLTYDERFLEGMNGSAVIMTKRVENVLLVPVAAIYEDGTGIYVRTLRDDKDETGTRVDITTGISDGMYAEVTGGLSENDVIRYENTGGSGQSGFGGFGGGPFGDGDPFRGGGNRGGDSSGSSDDDRSGSGSEGVRGVGNDGGTGNPFGGGGR